MSVFAPPRPPVPRPPPPPPPPVAKRWASRLPWRSAEAKAAPRDDLATVCLSLVSVAVALSLGRLFRGAEWIPYGVAAAALGHFLAWGLRRLGAGLTTASLASALLSILVAVELVVPEATTFGFPTPYTFQVLGQALTDAQNTFRSAVPPVAPADGYIAAAVVGVCMCAFLADWAAFRMRTAYEACIPGLALFVFSSVLGSKSYRAVTVAVFAAAALVFLIVQRANLDGGQTAWFGGRDRGALPSLLATGAVLGAVSVLGALVLSPHAPGATAKPIVPLKKSSGNGSGSGGGTRQTVSPLVDIQSRLVQFANVDVFRVKAQLPAYWRLTSLDRFDGTIWSANEKYAGNSGELPSSRLAGSELAQEITISNLSSIWLPAAYHPVAVDGVQNVSYSRDSVSLITKKDTSNGLTYKIRSVLPDVRPDRLRGARASARGDSELGGDFQRYTEVGRVSPRVQGLATDLARGKATPYDKAYAIQEHLRSKAFSYSLKADPGHSRDAIDRFLFVTKVGYCEQFAGSYAVLARLMGLPTRVAVGFQPGVEQGGTFSVLDKDAHAWPEVYFEGIGWVPFEPTPGSTGNPQATPYTNVPYMAAVPTGPNPGVTVPTAPTTVVPGSPAPAPPREEDEPASTDLPEADSDKGWASAVVAFFRRTAPLWLGLLAAAALVGGSAAFVAWERRRRRERFGGAVEARVHVAWEESIQALAVAGVRLRPAETVAELLHRLSWPAGGAALAGVERGTAAHDALLRLGHAVVESAYTGRDVPPAVADAAEADRDIIVGTCRASLGRWDRLKSAIDPCEAWSRLRSERAPRRPPSPADL